jgi:hypothetical protein
MVDTEYLKKNERQQQKVALGLKNIEVYLTISFSNQIFVLCD